MLGKNPYRKGLTIQKTAIEPPAETNKLQQDYLCGKS
jgi:hypothetical protein